MTSYVYDCSLLIVKEENCRIGSLEKKIVLKINTWKSFTKHAYWTFFLINFFFRRMHFQLIESDSMKATLV